MAPSLRINNPPRTAFKPGNLTGKLGGRPKGSKNKKTLELAAFFRSVLEDRKYRSRIRKELIDGKATDQMEVLAFYYAYGKPTETIRHEGEVTLNLRALLAEAKERARGQLAG